MQKTGFAIFGHGSTVESANESVREAARRFALEGNFDLVEPSFLELGQPDLAGAVAKLIERGAGRVIVLPYFLTLGKHLQRDLPRIAGEIAGIHPGVEIRIAPPLDGHPALAAILVERAQREIESAR